MKRTIKLYLVIVLLNMILLNISSAQGYQKILKIDLNITNNWEVKIINYEVLELDYVFNKSEYNLTNPDILTASVISEDGVVSSIKFNVGFMLMSNPPSILDETTKTIYLKYSDHAEEFKLEQHGKVILIQDLSNLCNHDAICNNDENYLSCPSDCKSYEKDRYCNYERDDGCDPDCPENVDWDCRNFSKIFWDEIITQKSESEQIEYEKYFIIILICFLLIFLLILVRKKIFSKSIKSIDIIKKNLLS